MKQNSRIKIAVILFIVSYIAGWPLLIGIEAAAAYYKSSFMATVVAPAVYIASWIPWIIGFIIGGPPALQLAKDSLRKIFSKKHSPDS